MFLLYSLVILLTLPIIDFTVASIFIYLLLFAIAMLVAWKTYLLNYEIQFSESGLIENAQDDKHYSGVISGKSFYNNYFIFLTLEVKHHELSEKKVKQFIVIYKDAICEEYFRLIAQIINNRRH